MKSCLVTGANGLVGKCLLDMLNGWDVCAVTRDVCDLAQPFTFRKFPKRVDAVIHLAQSRNFRDFPNQTEEIFAVNTTSTLRLLEYARKADCTTFVYASTGGVYDERDFYMFEDRPVTIRPNMGFYTTTKLCSEILVSNFTPYFNTVILRPFFIYGKGQDHNMLIPRLVNSVKTGLPITLQGNAGLMINPTHVSDAALAVRQAMNLKDSHIINVAGPEVVSLREIGTCVGSLVGKKPNFVVQSVKPHHIIGDTALMEKLLVKPSVLFKDGVKEMVD